MPQQRYIASQTDREQPWAGTPLHQHLIGCSSGPLWAAPNGWITGRHGETRRAAVAPRGAGANGGWGHAGRCALAALGLLRYVLCRPILHTPAATGVPDASDCWVVTLVALHPTPLPRPPPPATGAATQLSPQPRSPPPPATLNHSPQHPALPCSPHVGGNVYGCPPGQGATQGPQPGVLLRHAQPCVAQASS